MLVVLPVALEFTDGSNVSMLALKLLQKSILFFPGDCPYGRCV